MKWCTKSQNGRGLLQAEPELSRPGASARLCRSSNAGWYFHCFKASFSSLMKQRGAGKRTFMDVTRPVASINASTRTLPETCWLLASHRICWRHRKNQSCRFDVSANGKRRCGRCGRCGRRGRRGLFVASNKTGSERFYAGPRLSIAA